MVLQTYVMQENYPEHKSSWLLIDLVKICYLFMCIIKTFYHLKILKDPKWIDIVLELLLIKLIMIALFLLVF